MTLALPPTCADGLPHDHTIREEPRWSKLVFHAESDGLEFRNCPCKGTFTRETDMQSIGSGIFVWDGFERRSNRYGSFFLTASTNCGAVAKVSVDERRLKSIIGKRVRIAARVVEARKSGHIGDLFLGIFPSKPAVGETVEIGVGTLRLGRADTRERETTFILEPGDGRDELWIDPRKLYRLHEQTVEILAEETADDFTPAPDLAEAESGAIGTGEEDDSVQTKRVRPQDVRAPVDVEHLGEGVVAMRFRQPRAGEKLDVQPRSPFDDVDE